MRYTKILLTTKNSEWGIITHPVAMNTYQNILSFDTPELKDWFINKHLFGDENFDYKSKIKLQPSKPTSIISDVNATFRVDQKDYPNETEATLLNKDFAIILEYDDDENTPYENYTFWAINKATIEAGHLISYRCEIDIFFTYDIKDIFKDEPIQIDRAHSNRFLDNGLPDIFKDSINSFTEIFDDMFQFSFNNIENLFSRGIKSMYFIANANDDNEKNLIIVDNLGIPHGVKEKISIDISMGVAGEIKFPSRIEYSSGVIFGKNEITSLIYHSLAIFNSSPSVKIPPSFSPVEIHTYNISTVDGTIPPEVELIHTDNEGNETTLSLNIMKSYGYEALNIPTPFKTDISELKDITKQFNWKFEGKIFKQPYHQIEVIDILSNTYQIDISNMTKREQIDFEINAKISIQGLHCQILFNDNFPAIESTNIIYGIYNIYNTTTDKEINEWDQYEAEHKAQFGVQKTSGVIHTIFGGLNAVKDFAKGNLFGGANEIANSWQGLANTLAMQHDLQNAPREIIAGGNIQHILNSEWNGFNGRDFYQINLRKPNNIILERLAWLFHIAGVNYSQTFHNPNDLLKSRYYFNYIKTSMSLFENIKEEYTISQKLRALIDNSLKEGLTIWHIRDKNTFKGVKHYNVNNVEMEWLK